MHLYLYLYNFQQFTRMIGLAGKQWIIASYSLFQLLRISDDKQTNRFVKCEGMMAIRFVFSCNNQVHVKRATFLVSSTLSISYNMV